MPFKLTIVRECMDWGHYMAGIGSRVKTLRLSKRLNQDQLAGLIGVSQPAVAKIENGKTRTLKGSTLERLAAALSSTTTFIMYGADSSDHHEHEMMQAEMVAIFRDLPMADKEVVLRMSRGILPSAAPKSLPAPAKMQKFPV